MSFPFRLVEGTVNTVTAFNAQADEPVKVVNANHPHYGAILAGLRAGDPGVWDLFDVGRGIARKFAQVTERVSWDGSDICWDGDPQHSALAQQLVRAMTNGETASEHIVALATFWEKVDSNPQEHSREQAYDWLTCHNFMITPEGDVVGYKGVKSAGSGYVSTRASQVAGVPSAYVDGEPVPPQSLVPNNIGTVVSMPRSEVQHNPREACARGLHVSTQSYAKSYGYNGAVLEVHVNPRDIVSVPTDGGGQKVRACRYYVARVALDVYPNQTILRQSEPTENVWKGDVGYKV